MKSFPLKSLLFFIIIFSIQQFSFSQEKIISSGDNWFYFIEESLPLDWYKTKTNQNKWKQGKTPIGYGDTKVTTHINFGSDKENKHLVKYFYKPFIIKNINEFIAFNLKVIRDDGIIVYLNGREIYRNNLPPGLITSKTEAVEIVDLEKESEIHSKIIDAKNFRSGKNIIQVAVHQVHPQSSDVIFDLDLIGYKEPNLLAEIVDKKTEKNISLQNQVKDLNNQFQLEKAQLKIELLKNSTENYKYTLYILFFLLTLTVIGSFYFFTDYKKKAKINSKTIEDLTKTNLENEKELMTLSTRLLYNKQYFKEIRTDLKGLKTDDNATIKSINHQINSVLNKDDEWEALQKHFNTICSGFYSKLLERHPSLTEIELRHCMFIKMHLLTKEVAKILLVDPRSVQTARYRIKKKLELGENEDLRDYLLKI